MSVGQLACPMSLPRITIMLKRADLSSVPPRRLASHIVNGYCSSRSPQGPWLSNEDHPLNPSQ